MKIKMNRTIFLILFLVLSYEIFSLETSINFNEVLTTENSYQYIALQEKHKTDYFDFIWRFSVCNDGKYQPSHGKDFYFGYYFLLEQGGLGIKYNDLSMKFGRLQENDIVDTPYSLFVSSKNLNALLLDISYNDNIFFFTSRWTELNRNSALGFPDRGWQYNVYGLKLKGFRIGFQDSLIYAGCSFDADYFLDPLPGFFKQYTRISPGKPWQSVGNDNSIMGFFADYRENNLYGYGQLLIDDFNANAILNPDSSYQNPNKLAWSFGGSYHLNFGTIGLYHAGSTKYTFQPTGYGDKISATDERYGYSYYPAVSYTANGEVKTILPENNYIGYYNGENNISFLSDYKGNIRDFNIYSSLEFSLSGEKSPANPWGIYTNWTQEKNAGTKLLDSIPLEKKLILTINSTRTIKFYGSLSFMADLKLGYIWNSLQLADVPTAWNFANNNIDIFSPSNNSFAVFSFSIGITYILEF